MCYFFLVELVFLLQFTVEFYFTKLHNHVLFFVVFFSLNLRGIYAAFALGITGIFFLFMRTFEKQF